MSLKIGKKTIKCKVEFVAEGDLGDSVDASFVIIYKRPSSKEGKDFNALNAKFADEIAVMTDKESQLSITDRSESVNKAEQEMSDFVRERITGWEQVFDDENESLAFSDEALSLLFDDREARRAVFNRYQGLVSFRKKEEEKNLEKQGKDGQ